MKTINLSNPNTILEKELNEIYNTIIAINDDNNDNRTAFNAALSRMAQLDDVLALERDKEKLELAKSEFDKIISDIHLYEKPSQKNLEEVPTAKNLLDYINKLNHTTDGLEHKKLL